MAGDGGRRRVAGLPAIWGSKIYVGMSAAAFRQTVLWLLVFAGAVMLAAAEGPWPDFVKPTSRRGVSADQSVHVDRCSPRNAWTSMISRKQFSLDRHSGTTGAPVRVES